MASSINASTAGVGGVITTADNTGILNIQTAGTTAITVNASQNVGIGTTSPNVSGQTANVKVATVQGLSGSWGGVEVSNTSTSTANLLGFYGFTSSGATAGYTMPAYIGTWLNDSGTATKLGANLRFFTQSDNTAGAAERMRIDSSGNLGLGVTPSAGLATANYRLLQIGNAGSASIYGGQAQSLTGLNISWVGGTPNYETTATATYYEQYQGRHAWFTAPSGTAGTAITFTERMRIDASGNLMVGATSQFNDGKICSQFDGNTTNGLALKTTRTALNSTYVIFANSAGSAAGSITQTGTTTVAYGTSSDYRLKENVAPMVGALDKVALLKPVTYTWKNTDGELGEGFIAHELAEVCPLAVIGEKDAVNEDGSVKSQSIDTSFLVATLVAAIQELKAEIDLLKGAK